MPISSRDIRNLHADLAFCAAMLQNSPERMRKAFEQDKTSFEEVKELTGDLFSIFEAIADEHSDKTPS